MNQDAKIKHNRHQKLKQILQLTVDDVRKFLKCDRVIIYNSKQSSKAGILAESKNENCTSLAGKIVKDPFLEGVFLEVYRDGKAIVVDDVYVSDVNNNGLRDLQHLEIKSAAVAPIYVDGKLMAFLAAHHCDQNQSWSMQTADYLVQKATGIELTIAAIIKSQKATLLNSRSPDLILSEAVAAKEVNKPKLPPRKQLTLIQETQSQLFAALKNKIVNNSQHQGILPTIAAELRLLLNCDRVLIYSLSDANCGKLVTESTAMRWHKVADSQIAHFSLSSKFLTDNDRERVYCWNNINDENIPAWYKEQLAALKIKAGSIAPITSDGELLGLLIAHQCSHTRTWQKQEIDWIATIANYTGNMIENRENFENLYARNRQEQQLADTQPQLEKEKKWMQHFADVVQQLRKSLNQKDILKVSVSEIHQVLDCDRVLVYALNHDSYGKIVAESVSSGWTKAEGRTIKDPCFEARYLAKYRDGRFRAWSNIYESNMSPCYIEQLEQLEVKANLVVPIIHEGKLFGLLVAHQCSGTRQWQQAEILWLIQIATQIGFALDNCRLIADAQELRQQAEQERIWTEYFADAVQQIRQSLRTKDIYQAAVREVRRVINCDRVVVYGLTEDSYGKIVAESVAHGWTKAEGRIIKDPCFEARYLNQYRDGRVRAWNDIYEANMSSCYIEQLEKLEVKANLVVPITNGGKLFGLLVAHQCSGTRQWQQPEIDWLVQIALQVALTVENAQMLEKIQHNTQITQDIIARAASSSSNIQRTVQSVTAGFASLDNSCQDFAETIEQVKDLSKQLAQQSMGMSRIINFSQAEGNNQNSVAELSDNVFSLMQELFEATAKIDPLFNSIKTEIKIKASTLESETQGLTEGVKEFQTASQNLEEIVALNSEMSNLVEKISESLETQIKGSTFAGESIHELAQITGRISQQSLAVVQSLNQLVLLNG